MHMHQNEYTADEADIQKLAISFLLQLGVALARHSARQALPAISFMQCLSVLKELDGGTRAMIAPIGVPALGEFCCCAALSRSCCSATLAALSETHTVCPQLH